MSDEKNKIGNSAIEQALMSIIDPFVSGIANGVDGVIKENEKLKAENDRYLKALLHITSKIMPNCCSDIHDMELSLENHYYDIAREALKGGE